MFFSFYSSFSKQQQQYFHSLCANSGTFAAMMKEIIIFKIVLYKLQKSQKKIHPICHHEMGISSKSSV